MTVITYAFCAVIVALALTTAIQIEVARATAKRRINGVQAVVDTPGPYRAEHRAHLARTAKEHEREVAHLWGEFDETLVTSPDGRLLNTQDADYHFRSEALAPELLHSRILLTRPAVLTVLGVLGTFTGLAVGLSAIDLNGDTDHLTEGVGTLINGARFAFITSVVGVVGSVVVQALEKGRSRGISRDIRRLQATIDERFEKQTAEASLVSIMHSSSASQEHLSSLGEQIGASLQAAVAPAMERLTEHAARQSEQVFEQLVGKFAAHFEALGTTLADRLDSSTRALTQTIDYLGEKLAQQADEHHERMVQIRELTSQQVQLLSQHLPAVVDRLETATGRLDEVGQQLVPAAEHLRATSESFASTSTTFGDLLDRSTETLDSVTAQQAQATTSLEGLTERLGVLTVSTVSAAAKIDGAAGLLEDGLDGLDQQQRSLLAAMREQQDSYLTGLREHQEESLTALTREIDGFRTSLSSWFTEYSEAVERHTTSRMSTWNESTSAFTSTMLDAAKALSATVEEIDTALEARRRDEVEAAA
ncbi:ABC-type transporter Mla subunit MlaD [Isoptericola jiangsuensis]|uniref:ABC-type transporter Mla subunit MlaD n=2 Tax=Isoptericola jiangsuensis TaxID=548579 RepID=A0A2A9EW82_9MICO|nr:ABC-type transporter Mla subunit MlaD [Isoptericola jiangsuensis]